MSRSIHPVDIAVSGLQAQALRMQVISHNIANAQTTDVGNGQPYRRQEVTFSTSDDELGGVQISGVTPDMSTELKRVHKGVGYPGADARGFVTMPNVSMPQEMMDMIVASRAYQASASVLKRYQDLTDTTLELLR
jgi:flagellar basal-body rod protein FlgC